MFMHNLTTQCQDEHCGEEAMAHIALDKVLSDMLCLGWLIGLPCTSVYVLVPQYKKPAFIIL